eukprot:260335-Alexandrium_andersonii.AAC.1
MSASLVGSEMCIRDRCAACITDEVAVPVGPQGSPAVSRPWAPDVCPEAVSYTHLTLPTICSV